MMNILCSKHVEDKKNSIKTLIWKSVHFVGLQYIIKTEVGYTVEGRELDWTGLGEGLTTGH